MTTDTAKITFNELGTPVSGEFDDVYFSNQSGLAESQYVFIANNGLPERWLQWQEDEFVITETGFGTGLNFLAVWQAFAEFKQNHPNTPLKRLHFISTEKYPLTQSDLKSALAHWPQVADYAEALIEHYPYLLPGCQRRYFQLPLHQPEPTNPAPQASVILDLWIGDIAQTLPQLPCPDNGLVDAWFLDGFAPSKNPEMWQPGLFQHMRRLSKANASYATFTAAGVVKRGLAAEGFTVNKVPGFGKKREMLKGEAPNTLQPDAQHQAYWHRYSPTSANSKKSVAIIGAGLAGANLAYAFAQKGYQVDVYFQDDTPATGASGNPQGGFYPHLTVKTSVASSIYAQCFSYAKQHYQGLLSQGYDFAHQWCGALLLGFNDKVQQRQHSLVAAQTWPAELVAGKTPEECRNLAGLPLGNTEASYDGLWIPDAGWLNLPQLIQACFDAAADLSEVRLHSQKQLQSLSLVDADCLSEAPKVNKTQENHWQITWQDGSQNHAQQLIFATGANSTNIEALQGLDFRPVRGQIEHLPTAQPLGQLQTVLCHKGYITPPYQDRMVLGSTYNKSYLGCDFKADETQQNMDVLNRSLKHCDWTETVKGDNQGRAAIRCGTPDHLPLMGAVPNLDAQQQQYQDLYKALPISHYEKPNNWPNLYMLCGLGSRGLCTAPLLAEALSCQLSGKALPFEQSLLQALNPNRYLIRKLIRREI